MIKKIKSITEKEGFILIGFLPREDAKFPGWIDLWLEKGYFATLDWMKGNKAIREDPCSIFETGKSIISLAFPYNTSPPEGWENRNPISNYAWGEDYHVVLKKKLRRVMIALSDLDAGFQGQYFVDTAPLPEKVIAVKAGLGWIGKNSMLINPDFGSYLFLSEIVCNLELPSFVEQQENLCGDCNLCIENCPTKSIKPNSQIDARTCISYLTIEKRGDFSTEEAKSIAYQLFGCDICQQVCPWNKKVMEITNSPFNCFKRWKQVQIENLVDLTKTEFDLLKQKSPVKRAKLEGLRRNAAAILKH